MHAAIIYQSQSDLASRLDTDIQELKESSSRGTMHAAIIYQSQSDLASRLDTDIQELKESSSRGTMHAAIIYQSQSDLASRLDTGISQEVLPFLKASVLVKGFVNEKCRYHSSGTLIKYGGCCFVTTMSHCISHEDVTIYKLILRENDQELQYSSILHCADTNRDLICVFVLEDLPEVLHNALEICTVPLLMGSLVCGVGGVHLLHTVSGFCVGTFEHEEYYIDSRTAVNGFSGAGVGIHGKVVAVVQGGRNWSGEKVTKGYFTTADFGKRWIEGLQNIAEYSQTLTRLVSVNVLLPELESYISSKARAGSASEQGVRGAAASGRGASASGQGRGSSASGQGRGSYASNSTSVGLISLPPINFDEEPLSDDDSCSQYGEVVE
jgi:hypothetical protein